MKTSQLERVTAKFKLSARRARMPIYSWFCAEDAAALVSEKSTSYWGTRLREHREYARQCSASSAKTPPASRLVWSESLRVLVEEIADGGCPVAEALLKARKYRHAHARKLAGNHFSFREKAGMISFLPAGRTLVVNDAGLWARDGRQETKPVKWAKSVLANWQLSRLRDEHFSAFAARFAAAENASALRVELIEDVGAVYGDRNHCEQYVGVACMQQSHQADYDNGRGERVGDFYERAGAQVLTVRRGDGRLEGRAIYWPVIRGLSDEDVAGLDRVYGSPEVLEMVRAWARDNNVAMRSNPQSGGDTAWMLNGESLGRGAYVVPARSLDSAGFFPYMDTFRYQDEDGDLWTEDDKGRTVYEYTSVHGDREERNRHEGKVQLHDGTWHDEDEAYYVESESAYYASEDVVHCYRSDSYILREGAFEVEIGRNNTLYLSAEYVTEL